MNVNLRNLPRWPLYALQVLTGAKDFTRNPILGSTTLNTWGLHVARKRLAHALCDLRRAVMASRVPHASRTAYAAQGYVVLPGFLPEDEFQQVKKDVLALSAEVIEMAQWPALTRRMNLDAQTCAHLPALQRLLRNSQLLNTLRYAAGYSGSPIIAVQCIHNDRDRPDGAHDPQTDWHCDTFHSTAKAWLFLHDVALDEGPFAYIPGSHAPTPARLAWEKRQSLTAPQHANRLHAKGSFRADESDLTEMGLGEAFTAAVAGNTLVVADTSGFHRRSPSAQPTTRVEIYLSLRRNPFFAGLYPSLLGLPWVGTRWATVALNYYKARLRAGKPDWLPTGGSGLRGDERRRLGE